MINSVGNKMDQSSFYENISNKTYIMLSENKTDNIHTKLSELDKLQNKEIMDFLKKIKEDYIKSEFIATKVIKGKDISKQELSFINNKQPGVKKIIEETMVEHLELEKKINECKSSYEKELIMQSYIKNIYSLEDETIYTKLKAKLKMIKIIEDTKLYNQSEVKKEIEKLLKKMISSDELMNNQNEDLNNAYMSAYLSLQNIFLKPLNISILIIIVSVIILFV